MEKEDFTCEMGPYLFKRFRRGNNKHQQMLATCGANLLPQPSASPRRREQDKENWVWEQREATMQGAPHSSVSRLDE